MTLFIATLLPFVGWLLILALPRRWAKQIRIGRPREYSIGGRLSTCASRRISAASQVLSPQ